MKYDLRMLNHVDDIVEYFGKGTTLKMTFVQFNAPNGCRKFTATCTVITSSVSGG
jgi:hypothetical protein